MNNIIDGVKASLLIKKGIKEQVMKLKNRPSLAVIQVGDDKASNVYIRNKSRACEEVGIEFKHFKFEDGVLEKEIIDTIKSLNNDENINGILVQLPLPSVYNEGNIINTINPLKDVDGLTYQNVGNLVLGNECLKPCTPLAVMNLLKIYGVNISGKNVCIIGRSNLVGKPLIQLLLKEDATVTVCHSKSVDIKKYTKLADVLIVAAGHPKLVSKEMIKEGCVVIDVGINKKDGVLCGDVDFDDVIKKASLITPVPGGVGPMTVACLLSNVIKAYKVQN